MLVLNLVIIGLAIALDPLPLTAFILVLGSKRGVRKGAAFVFGWLVSLGVVMVVTVLATGNNPPKPNTAPSLASLAIKIALGVVLLLIALRQRRRMGRPKKPKKPPKWKASVDTMSPWYALALAPLLQPWGLIAAGVANIVEAKLASWESYLSLLLFALIATSSYIVMQLYSVFRSDRSQAFLAGVQKWIDANTDQIIVIGSLVLGFWLIADSLYLILS